MAVHDPHIAEERCVCNSSLIIVSEVTEEIWGLMIAKRLLEQHAI